MNLIDIQSYRADGLIVLLQLGIRKAVTWRAYRRGSGTIIIVILIGSKVVALLELQVDFPLTCIPF